MDYIKTFTLWLAFVWASVSPLAILAQTDSEALPAKFRQVVHLDEITAGDAYLIGAEYEIKTSQLNRGFCLLTNYQGSTTLIGAESVYPLPSVLESSKDYSIWTFRKEEDGYVLFSPSANKGVALKRGSSTSLMMSAETFERWNLNEVENGLFTLQSKTDVSRALGLNWFSENKINFGLYKIASSIPTKLRIYKKIVNLADLPGKAVKPADGSRLCLGVDNKVLAMDKGTPALVEIEEHLLENDSIAHDETLPFWICKHTRDNAFLLKNVEGVGLEHLIGNIPENMEWRVDNGYIVTNEQEQRYLVRTAESGFALATKEQLTDQHIFPVLFLMMSSAPQIDRDGNGRVRLLGGWSRQRLSELDWKGVQLLDLTRIGLPLLSFDFDKRPVNSNALIFVSEKTKTEYINRWKNVVVGSEQGTNVWKNIDVLHDREPWAIDREVKIDNGQLTYCRFVHTDGNWETIYLPFSASLPEGFELCRFEKMDNGSVLIFQKCDEIVANEPMMVRYIGPNTVQETTRLELRNKGGFLKPVVMDNRIFSGTYVPYEVTSTDDGVYLLNMMGENFVRAAVGSCLSPFRAAFRLADESKVLRLKLADEEVAGISKQELAGRRKTCYSLDGKMISSDLSTGQFDRLPRGIYLIDGKKYLK